MKHVFAALVLIPLMLLAVYGAFSLATMVCLAGLHSVIPAVPALGYVHSFVATVCVLVLKSIITSGSDSKK